MEFDSILARFKSDLEKIESEQPHRFLNAQQAIKLCQNFLFELKSHMVNHIFTSTENEIHFFKHVKNLPLTNLIFYAELKSFETYFPRTNRRAQEKFIRNKLSRLNDYFLRHIDFGQYLELGSTYLDEFYYTRQCSELDLYYFTNVFLPEPEFSTPRDFLLAEFTARKRFAQYVSKKLDKPGVSLDTVNAQSGDPVLKWTGSRTALTELIYALHYTGAINYGTTEIKDLARGLEHLFNFDLGDYYKTYSEIKARKKSRTKFLEELMSGLQSEMNRSEQ